MTTSPFRAGFGKSPPLLAGRDDILDQLSDALVEGTWTSERASLVEGLRGVGKTVLLNAVEDRARERGWIVVSETATPGFTDRIARDHLARAIHRVDPPPTHRLKGVTVGPGAVDLEPQAAPDYPLSLRSQLQRAAELNAPRGILITLDEISLRAADDLAHFTAEIQHAIREDLEVTFVGAGLSDAITELLSQRSLTFLRRAVRMPIGLLMPDDVKLALQEPIEDAGRTIDEDALEYAMRAAQGYPFMAQLIGDLSWKVAPERDEIVLQDVKVAYPKARRRMGANIHSRALRELSPTDRTVLAHMALSDGPSAVADLRRALGVNPQHLNVYRQRLIDAGMIRSAGHGQVDFALPYLRDYLREHTVTDAAGRLEAMPEYPPAPELDDEEQRG